MPSADSARDIGYGQSILVVEDEPAIRDVLVLYLERAGFSVESVGDGRLALDTIRRKAPAAIILDVGLPGIDGTEVCRALRAEGNWTPILFCTARDDEVDRVLGLERGGDDYITKPFSPREVVARVRVALRHSQVSSASDVLRAQEISLDRTARRVFVQDTEIDLTATEFDLLAHLMAHPGRVVSRDQLLVDVWGYASAVSTRTVDVHVAQLRHKLQDASPIRTVRGVGYSVDRESR
ncbi:MAG: response regulator transcription factor [Candidatus Nanopelagicales bacterium]